MFLNEIQPYEIPWHPYSPLLVALFPVQFQQELLGIAADRFLAGQLQGLVPAGPVDIGKVLVGEGYGEKWSSSEWVDIIYIYGDRSKGPCKEF